LRKNSIIMQPFLATHTDGINIDKDPTLLAACLTSRQRRFKGTSGVGLLKMRIAAGQVVPVKVHGLNLVGRLGVGRAPLRRGQSQCPHFSTWDD
jgi:hypothetical protein